MTAEENISLDWGVLELTVKRGILPPDNKVQVMNLKPLKNEANNRYRLILSDGVRTFKNAIFEKRAQLPPPDIHAVIRIGTDVEPENAEESIIKKVERGDDTGYAYIFFHYTLICNPGRKIKKPEESMDSSRRNRDDIDNASVCSHSTSDMWSVASSDTDDMSQPNRQLPHTPPNQSSGNKMPPPYVRSRSQGRPGTSGGSGTSQRGPRGADGAPAPLRRPNLDAVKRNLADSYPPAVTAATTATSAAATSHSAAPPSKRQNTGGAEPVNATHEIAAINPMMNRYSIKVRVSEKQPIKEISTARWEGKVINCKLSDASGDIMLKGFNAEAEELDSKLQNGSTYLISGARVAPVRDSRFNSTNHNYELAWSQYTKVTGPFLNSKVNINYKFVPIGGIRDLGEGTNVDVCGWVKDTGNMIEFTSKSNKDLKKREVELTDNSTGGWNTITLTLWGKMAEEFNAHNKVIALKGAKIGEWQGVKNLSLGFTGSYEVEPDVPGIQDLVEWAGSQAATQMPTQNMQRGANEEFTTIQDLKDELLAHKGEKKCSLYAWITRIKPENILYLAHMPRDGNRCQKKVLDTNGRLECVKCGKKNIPEEDTALRFTLKMNIADCTESAWCSAFDAGEKVLQCSPQRINEIRQQGEEELQSFLLSRTLKAYVIRVNAKIETYNDAPQLRLVVNDIEDPGWDKGEPMQQDGSEAKESMWKTLTRHMRDEVRRIESDLQVDHTMIVNTTWNQWIDNL